MREHGTYARYVSGCRCDLCRAAASARYKEYRKDPVVRARDSERHRESRKRRRSQLRDAALLARHGITRAQWQALLDAQQGRCAIDGADLSLGRGPFVDHDHQTGRVRALLCLKCNVGLGAFADRPEILRKAADYLEQHRQPDSTEAVPPKETP